MVSGDFCEHDWPGSGCPECKRTMTYEPMKPPEHYAQLALEAESTQNWGEAEQLWLKARTASAGHNRRARYTEAARLCKERSTEMDEQSSAPYRDGWHAHRLHLNIHQNPYNEHRQTYSHAQWRAGWHARHKAVRNNQDTATRDKESSE